MFEKLERCQFDLAATYNHKLVIYLDIVYSETILYPVIGGISVVGVGDGFVQVVWANLLIIPAPRFFPGRLFPRRRRLLPLV